MSLFLSAETHLSQLSSTLQLCIDTKIAQVLEYRVRVRRGEDTSWSSSRLVRTESTDTVFSGKNIC